MKKVLFLTNYPSPYRVRFFDELANTMDVTVLFSDRIEDKKHRSARWYIEGNQKFHVVHLSRRAAVFHSNSLCLDVTEWLKRDFDAIVVCGYANPTNMLAICYLALHKIPFYMEVDGGLIRQEGTAQYHFKKFLVSKAACWLSTGKETTKFLAHYGAQESRVQTYPFSSLNDGDICEKIPTADEKAELRRELGISEEKMVLSIGQFIHRKGFDVLLQAAASMEKSIGIYIVGGEPTAEYLQMRENLHLPNVHFVGFQKKEELARYYRAADAFVLPTREDIWGRVINEAMAYGLPVVTTDKCVAGMELVEDGVNGCIVPVNDPAALAEKLNAVLAGDLQKMGEASLEKIRPYTIENMAKVHAEIFAKGM